MKKREWVRLPSKWIEDGGLKQLQWTNSEASGSNNIAALMVLAPIAHHADDEGMAICTYDRLARHGPQPCQGVGRTHGA